MIFNVKKQEYKPLVDKNVYNRKLNNTKAQLYYEQWVDRLRRTLNYTKSKTIMRGIPKKNVSDFRFVFQKMLSDILQSENYIVYIKKQKLFNLYNIKVKPKNCIYETKIMTQSRRKWENVHKHLNKKINKNPKNYSVIVKRTFDETLASWYKSVIESDFIDYVVEIQKVVTNYSTLPQFNVIINCNININVNINTNRSI